MLTWAHTTRTVKEVLRAAAGQAFIDWGPTVEVDYGAGRPARVDGTVSGTIAVEVESRTSKHVRGAVLDLLFHPYPKKLLVLVPMYMSNSGLVRLVLNELGFKT